MRARSFLAMLALLVSLHAAAEPQASQDSANSNPEYKALRAVGLGGEKVAVANYVMDRDAGTFRFTNGTFQFLAPVRGKVTGAVFVGEGTFELKPPLPSEQALLKQLTKEPVFIEQFNTLVLRFTDRTYEELKSAGKSATETADVGASAALAETQDACQKKLHWNLTARILSDVLRESPGGLFVAFVKGKKYSGKMVYIIDPTGAPGVAPEEISLSTYEPGKEGTWTAFHYSNEYRSGVASGSQPNAVVKVEHQKLDTQLDRAGYLRGSATTTLAVNVAALRMVSFNLYETLRVQKVTGAAGEPLGFIQEAEDAGFWVLLPEVATSGDKLVITTVYEGKDALRSESGNFLPAAGDGWYPRGLGRDYATYEMTFTLPKALDVAATGEKVNDRQEGDTRVSTWKSEAPQPSAAFLYGAIKPDDVKSGKLSYVLQSYTNKEQPKWAARLAQAPSLPPRSNNPQSMRAEVEAPKGIFSTVQLSRDALAETEAAVKLMDLYFGGMPYKHLAVTQEAGCNPGQSLPQVIYLPMCAFMDSATRNSAGFFKEGHGYWMSVAAHEVAHQWWGNTVSTASYRDEWIRDGFAAFSAGLYLQVSLRDNKGFMKYWNDWQDALLEKDKEGRRPLDLGPLNAAVRLAGGRSTDVAEKLLTPKGGYVLHMIRQMMFDEQSGDRRFQEMMREFVNTYRSRFVTTEDFKRAVEKHMTPAMNLMGDGRMDWFFNEYVYGAALPSYNLQYSFDHRGNDVFMKIKATQSNVDASFAMAVPLYLDLGKERVVRVGLLNMFGNSTVEQEVPLGPMKDVPKRAVLNYMDDVLAGK